MVATLVTRCQHPRPRQRPGQCSTWASNSSAPPRLWRLDMPRLDYSVTEPQGGTVVGRSITVSGAARVLPADSGNLLEITISGVQVDFGTNGLVLDAHVADGA